MKTSRVRLWLEIAGFVVTVIGCLIAFYQLIGPTLRADERTQLSNQIVEALTEQGVTVPEIDTSKPTAEIAEDIVAAVAEVRDVMNAFELAAGQSKEVTDHGILVTNLGVRNSDGRVNELRGGVAGEVFQMTLGKSYPLPSPANNCTVAVVQIEDWWAIHRQEMPDTATFRVRCS